MNHNHEPKRVALDSNSPLTVQLVNDHRPVPVVIRAIDRPPIPINVNFTGGNIISGAANLHNLGDVASDGDKVLGAKGKSVLMYNADGRHPGKWMAGEVDLSDYATKNDIDKLRRNLDEIGERTDEHDKDIDNLDKKQQEFEGKVEDLRDKINDTIEKDIAKLEGIIDQTKESLANVKKDLEQKEQWLDGKISDVKDNLLETKSDLLETKDELTGARDRLQQLGVDHEILVGVVDEDNQRITTAITNIETEKGRVNILRSEMDGINLTITNEILSNLNDDDSEVTMKIGQKIDARAETIETAVAKLREGTDETITSWVGQKIDGRAETIETAVAKLREGTDETMVSWVGQKIDGVAETITTGIMESIEKKGFASQEFVGIQFKH